MASSVRKQAAGVVRHHDNETQAAGTGAAGTADVAQAKNGGERPQAPKPQPVEFGWDFPFDFPKPTR